MQHIILTRFNLAIKFECSKRHDSSVPSVNPWLDERYLEKRFDLFEKYTFKAFSNQSNKDFTWIVMFHKNTPPRYKDKITSYQNMMPQFLPMFFDDEQSLGMAQIISDYIKENYPDCIVITSRIDNDDFVHKTFVTEIQNACKNFPKGQSRILSLINGLQYNERTQDFVQFSHPNNHFLTLFADSKSPENHILFYNHAYIDEKGLQMEQRKTTIPLWVEIVHENNFSNCPIMTFTASYSLGQEYRDVLKLKYHNRIGWTMCLIASCQKYLIYKARCFANALRTGRKNYQ